MDWSAREVTRLESAAADGVDVRQSLVATQSWAQDSAKKLTSLKGQCTTLRLGRDLLEDEVLLASSS